MNCESLRSIFATTKVPTTYHPLSSSGTRSHKPRSSQVHWTTSLPLLRVLQLLWSLDSFIFSTMMLCDESIKLFFMLLLFCSYHVHKTRSVLLISPRKKKCANYANGPDNAESYLVILRTSPLLLSHKRWPLSLHQILDSFPNPWSTVSVQKTHSPFETYGFGPAKSFHLFGDHNLISPIL